VDWDLNAECLSKKKSCLKFMQPWHARGSNS
jgi:hypothetical protein